VAPDEPQISLVVMQSVPATRSLDPAHYWHFEDRGTGHRGFPLVRAANHPQALAEKFTLHRFAKTFFPLKNGRGHVPAVEILKSIVRMRECAERGDVGGKTLLAAIRDGTGEGMQQFDREIEKLIREGRRRYGNRTDLSHEFQQSPFGIHIYISIGSPA
jgi:Tfp pilus assembly ATPase PilU